MEVSVFDHGQVDVIGSAIEAIDTAINEEHLYKASYAQSFKSQATPVSPALSFFCQPCNEPVTPIKTCLCDEVSNVSGGVIAFVLQI